MFSWKRHSGKGFIFSLEHTDAEERQLQTICEKLNKTTTLPLVLTGVLYFQISEFSEYNSCFLVSRYWKWKPILIHFAAVELGSAISSWYPCIQQRRSSWLFSHSKCIFDKGPILDGKSDGKKIQKSFCLPFFWEPSTYSPENNISPPEKWWLENHFPFEMASGTCCFSGGSPGAFLFAIAAFLSLTEPGGLLACLVVGLQGTHLGVLERISLGCGRVPSNSGK